MYMNNNFYLPGDKPHQNIIDEIIRVDHSGEYGAIKIYQGQILARKHLAKLYQKQNNIKHHKFLQTLQKMHDSELPHYEFFQNLMHLRKSRPSFMLPFWSISGFIIGYITGIASMDVAMACTVGIEEIIGNHYNEQLTIVKEMMEHDGKLYNEVLLSSLYQKIEQFMHDELEHLNIGINNSAEKMCGYFYFNMLVKSITKCAISIAKNI